jgi:hypothetical protein
MTEPSKTPVCPHGTLRRQCEVCDLAEQLTAAESALAEVQDMATVGRALLDVTTKMCPDWAPADCPSEIVSDLVNARDEAFAERDAARAEAERLREDARRLAWALPVLCGVDSDEADKRALRLAGMLLTGLDGVAAIDAAMRGENDA